MTTKIRRRRNYFGFYKSHAIRILVDTIERTYEYFESFGKGSSEAWSILKIRERASVDRTVGGREMKETRSPVRTEGKKGGKKRRRIAVAVPISKRFLCSSGGSRRSFAFSRWRRTPPVSLSVPARVR